MSTRLALTPMDIPTDVAPVTEETPVLSALGDGGYRLFPFGVCRIADRPFDDLGRLRSQGTLDAAADLDRLEERLGAATDELMAALHHVVGDESVGGGDLEPGARKRLLAALRNLRRKGKLSATQEQRVRELGDERSVRALDLRLDLLERAEARRTELVELHDRELLDHGRRLVDLATDERFLRALGSSSPTVYRGLRQLREELQDDSSGTRNRNRRRLEQSLLKYYSRAAAKTTPFGSFTRLAAGLWRADDARPDRLVALPDAEPVSATHLNKAVYARMSRLLRLEPALHDRLAVTLNPSLHKTESGWVLWLARDGAEESVHLPPSPAVASAVAVIREHGGTCPYPELVRLLAETFGVDPEDLRPRIQVMVEAGILQLNTGIADHEPDWAPKLAHALDGTDVPVGRRILEALAALSHEQQRFSELDADGRLDLVERCRRHLDPIFEPPAPESTDDGPSRSPAEAGLVAEQRQSVTRNLFYEDCCLGPTAAMDAERLRPAFDSLARWIDWMNRYSVQWAYQANLRAFFDRRFPGAESVPFLTFYPEFYREVYEPILAFERDPTSGPFARVADPFGLPILGRSMGAAVDLRRTLGRLWQESPEAESVCFDRADLAPLDDAPGPAHEPGSASLFVQLLPRSSAFEKDALLVDRQATHAGMGRYFSRFLHGLDPRMVETLRRDARRFPDAVVAELCDDGDFSFNANLHPPLTDWEINYPARLTGSDPERNLDLAALEVRPDADDPHALRLFHRGLGKRVLPVDLGFVTPLRRPPLVRVLGLFSPFVYHRIFFPWGFEGETAIDERAPVVYRPRIVFEDTVVLSRRAWSVSAAELDDLLADPSPAEGFRALNRWHRENGLPEQVFFHSPRKGPATPLPDEPGADEDDGGDEGGSGRDPKAGRRRPTHKPQYLSFASIGLCELLAERVKDRQGRVVFEEVLPSPETLPTIHGRRHATEWVVQLDREVGLQDRETR